MGFDYFDALPAVSPARRAVGFGRDAALRGRRWPSDTERPSCVHPGRTARLPCISGLSAHHLGLYHGFLKDGCLESAAGSTLRRPGTLFGVAIFFMITGFLFWSQFLDRAGTAEPYPALRRSRISDRSALLDRCCSALRRRQLRLQPASGLHDTAGSRSLRDHALDLVSRCAHGPGDQRVRPIQSPPVGDLVARLRMGLLREPGADGPSREEPPRRLAGASRGSCRLSGGDAYGRTSGRRRSSLSSALEWSPPRRGASRTRVRPDHGPFPLSRRGCWFSFLALCRTAYAPVPICLLCGAFFPDR